jgi:CBS domain containing-hemolysin-like protein
MNKWLIIKIVWVMVLVGLLVVGSVASYLRLLMRRLTPVGARKLFRPGEGGRLKPDRERVGVSISALHGATMHLFAVGLTGLLILMRPEHLWANLGTALLLVLCAVAIADQLTPFLLVARHDEPEVILERRMPMLRLVVFLALPLTFPILVSTTIGRLLESPEPEPEAPNPQENLQELIEAGEQEGLLEKGEGELLQSVVDFGDKVVREVMTPRPEIAAVEIDAPVAELRRLFREKRQTRYPVYSKQLDHIEGIVNVRDLMELPPEEQAKVTIRSLVRPVPFVPETKSIRELLKEFQQSTLQMAIVIDEYGGVAGLVTIEDLLEEIVGEIRDEVEPHAQDIVKESATSYVVAGHTQLAQIVDQLQITIEGNDYTTVAGLVITQLGHVPSRGEKVEKNGVTFEVLEANPRTVLKVRLHLAPAESASAENRNAP